MFGLSETEARELLPLALERSTGRDGAKRRTAIRAYPLADGEDIRPLVEREIAEGKRDFTRRGMRVPCFVIACPRGASVVGGCYRLRGRGRAATGARPAWAAIFAALGAHDAAVLLDGDELAAGTGRRAVVELQAGLGHALWRESSELTLPRC